MKYVYSILMMLTYTSSHAQKTSNWSALFGAQKQYVSTVIAAEYRAAYLAQIHVAHIVHSKVWTEMKKNYPNFNPGSSWNMIEKFSPGGDLTGVIWSETPGPVCFQFIYGSDKRLVVSQNTLAQLSDTTSMIVNNFQNWNHTIFTKQGQLVNAPREQPFFMGSRVNGDTHHIICFTYP